MLRMQAFFTFSLITVTVTTESLAAKEPVSSRTRRAANHNCGPEVYRGRTGHIVTPNFPNPYDDSMTCVYSIRPKNYTLFRVHFLTCECVLEEEPSCSYDYIQFGTNTTKVCGTNTRADFIAWSKNGEVNVTFGSDGSQVRKGCYIVYAVQPYSP